jgi:hypothetical protein
VRVRPLSQDEIDNHGSDSGVSVHDPTSLTVFNAETRKQFNCAFDTVLGAESCQEDVYGILQTCTQSVTSGFNSTIFAYGECVLVLVLVFTCGCGGRIGIYR